VINRYESGERMSQLVVVGTLAFTAGQVDRTKAATVGEQTANVLANIERALALGGLTKRDIVSASIWLADMRHFDDMNAVWDAWVEPGHAPVRATVEARLSSPDYLVEVSAVAARS
jgi:enamine deaminase RidA (YjgF/YER057c/UK114 family)